MPRGYVTTARGEVINMDALKESATSPLVKQPKSEIQKKKVSRRRPLNIRGYKPTAGSATVPEMPDEVREALAHKEGKKPERKATPSSFSESGKVESMADITGLKIKEPKHLKEKPKDAAQASSEALGEILTELQGGNKEEEEKSPRRGRKKKKTTED